MARLLLPLLACVLMLSVAWQSSGVDEAAPPGCAAILDPTGRGGGTVSVGGGGCSFSNGNGAEKVRVIRVIDGDTIVVSGGRRVRYIGIDTPEVRGIPDVFGPEATDYNRRLVEGRTVSLVKDVSKEDRFGRLLRFVYADGILVNAELVREGFAEATAFEPDITYAGCFAALEREAAEAGRGMWGGVR